MLPFQLENDFNIQSKVLELNYTSLQQHQRQLAMGRGKHGLAPDPRVTCTVPTGLPPDWLHMSVPWMLPMDPCNFYNFARTNTTRACPESRTDRPRNPSVRLNGEKLTRRVMRQSGERPAVDWAEVRGKLSNNPSINVFIHDAVT
jgi:hypothetical protein